MNVSSEYYHRISHQKITTESRHKPPKRPGLKHIVSMKITNISEFCICQKSSLSKDVVVCPCESLEHSSQKHSCGISSGNFSSGSADKHVELVDGSLGTCKNLRIQKTPDRPHNIIVSFDDYSGQPYLRKVEQE